MTNKFVCTCSSFGQVTGCCSGQDKQRQNEDNVSWGASTAAGFRMTVWKDSAKDKLSEAGAVDAKEIEKKSSQFSMCINKALKPREELSLPSAPQNDSPHRDPSFSFPLNAYIFPADWIPTI